MQQDIYLRVYPEKQLESVASYFQQKIFENPLPLATSAQIMAEQLNNARQKVIKADSLRTRSSIFSEDIKHQLEKMLTHYCRIQNFDYMQGLNQIAAPFIYLRTAGVPIQKCEIYFHLFFSKYCMNFYDDKDFHSLQLFMKFFTVVLKYHDPSLCRYFECHEVEPQIFCIQWLMTLFANKLSLQLTYVMWLFLVTEKDRFLFFFLIVAIVLNNREKIMGTSNVHILKTVTSLIFQSEEEMHVIVQKSLLLRKNTPYSLVIFFRDRMIFQRREVFSDLLRLLGHLEKLNFFLVLPSQMALESHFKQGLCAENCYFCDLSKPLAAPKVMTDVSPALAQMVKDSNDLRSVKYMKQFAIVDIRRARLSNLGFRGVIFEVDLEQPFEQIQQVFLARFIEQKGKMHFVFVLSTFSFEHPESSDSIEWSFCQKLLATLFSFSFPLLGILQGGYEGLRTFSQMQSSEEIEINEAKSLMREFSIAEIQTHKLPIVFSLSLGTRFQLANGLQTKKYDLAVGILESMLTTEYLLIIFESQKSWESMAKNFEHSNSLMPYLYENTNSPANMIISKILPLQSLTKAAIKIHSRTKLVLHYEQCRHTEQSIFSSIDECLQFDIVLASKMSKICATCPKVNRKLYLELKSNEKPKETVQFLASKYINMKKNVRKVLS